MSSVTSLGSKSGARRDALGGHARFAVCVTLAGIALTLATFWPGYVPPDADDQFGQSLAFRFTDWHPPMMSVFWALLNHIYAGPQTMLLFQTLLFWAAVWCVLSALPAQTSRTVRWCVVAALVSPVMLNYLGVIAKDTQLMSAWAFVAATCWLVRSRGSEPHIALKILLCVLLLYGALVRQNSGLVAGPLTLYLFTGRAVLRSLAATFAVWIAIALVCMGLSSTLNRVVEAEHTQVLSSLIMFDMVGVSVRTGASELPFPVSHDEMESLRTCYNGGLTHDPLVWGACGFVHQRSGVSDYPDGVLIRDWLAMVAHHPVAYLAHRMAFFSTFSGLVTLQPAWGFWAETWDKNKHGFTMPHTPLYWAMKSYVYGALATPLLRVGCWFFAALGLWWLALRPDVKPEARAFSVMGTVTSLLYLLTYLPFGVAPEFRYAYPAIMLTTFSGCVLAPQIATRCAALYARWRGRHDAAAATPA